MSRRWFGTDGVRGEAGAGPLGRTFLVRLGRALGEQILGSGTRPSTPVLLARDTRISGPEITAALAAGLSRPGVPALDLGVLPTAGLAMAVRARGAPRGVVVSASHNPWADNGIKIFGAAGQKLTDDEERALEVRIEQLGGEQGEEPAVTASLATDDGAAGYVAALRERFGDLDLAGLRLAVDCAHGAASVTAPAVLEGLGADVVSLFDRPDGRNINAGCGSTHLAPLAQAVRGGRFDLGLAFDGDADRVLMVDARGRTCTGDHMLGFLGTWLAGSDALPRRAVVATVMSNLGLERRLARDGIALVRTAVGDRYVHAAMREGGYGLGGEASGHLLFGAEHDYTGDGMYTALRVLQGLRATGRDLCGVVDDVASVPQILRNVHVAARPPVEGLQGLQARVSAARAQHGDAVRIVLRYSGTENLARVMVEGLDADVVASLSSELADLWVGEIAARGTPSP